MGSYYQMNHTQKRIVEIKLIYDDFDKNATKTDYRLNVKFYPLNYQELIIKFAYSRGIFLLLFTLIGILTIFLAFLFWIIGRTRREIQSCAFSGNTPRKTWIFIHCNGSN